MATSNLCPRELQGTATRLLQHNKKISESNVTLSSARARARSFVRGASERARSRRDCPHRLSASAAPNASASRKADEMGTFIHSSRCATTRRRKRVQSFFVARRARRAGSAAFILFEKISADSSPRRAFARADEEKGARIARQRFGRTIRRGALCMDANDLRASARTLLQSELRL